MSAKELSFGTTAIETAPGVVAETFTSPEFFINRDLSLLDFTGRVLEEAFDESQPLLERLKFLAIVSSNLDEFFMIRVSGLKERLDRETGIAADGVTTADLLRQIKDRVSSMVSDQVNCLTTDVLPALSRAGVVVTSFESLSETERRNLTKYFEENIYPLLTPQAVDQTHPFPYISAGSINIGMLVRPRLTPRVAKIMEDPTREFFVRVKMPPSVSRLIPVEGRENTFVLAEEVVVCNIRRLVPEARPEECHLFRITRDADMDLRESETEDLLQTMEENLKLRRFGEVVRLEVSEDMPATLIDYLVESLDITRDDVYPVGKPLDISAFTQLLDVDRPDLKDRPMRVSVPDRFRSGESLFKIVREKDVLLHHPFMPHSIITDLIREATQDPDVLAIKMCLYRLGARSPIAPLLIEAAERGKQVTVVIEIKARFDEENNIEWAKRFEEAGIHVVYGLLGLKTHCKTTLIVRKEDDGLRRYVHLATGNYNPDTSSFYTDLGIITADEVIGADATELFNYLTGYALRGEFKRLLVAPVFLREKMLGLIERETQHALHGRPARIVAKMNRLADTEIVNALYNASRAGVQIDLIVRGICTLRPGIPGVSENIRVRSIIGRLLEHSRMYYFENSGSPEIYTGSSDWMPRNLDRRIEVLAPVLDPDIAMYLRKQFLETYLHDNKRARVLGPNGVYRRVTPEAGEEEIDSQLYFQAGAEVLPFQQP